jgi:hypothetical protein
LKWTATELQKPVKRQDSMSKTITGYRVRSP